MKKQNGFSMIEMLIVMAVIALILSITIPNFRGMQREGEFNKVETELNTLKMAVTSYWRHNDFAYPSNIHSDLVGQTPSLITAVLPDPFDTDSTNSTYGYTNGFDSTFGNWFIIYSKGPAGDTVPVFDVTDQRVEYTGSGRVVSNAFVEKF